MKMVFENISLLKQNRSKGIEYSSLSCLRSKVHSCSVPLCKPKIAVPVRRLDSFSQKGLQLPPTLILLARHSTQG